MPLVFCKIGQLRTIQPMPSRLMTRIDLIREELEIPWRELNKIAKNVVGREFKDVRFLGGSEGMRVLRYLEGNYRLLKAKYHQMHMEGLRR